jgi:uncharacterized peroxidase-related enzyme
VWINHDDPLNCNFNQGIFMAYIDLPPGIPGIIGLLAAYPDTARPLNAFTEHLLRGPSSLTAAERELIAAFVSRQNECTFCMRAHSAVARNLISAGLAAQIDAVVKRGDFTSLDLKMQALLHLAASVQKGGRYVTQDHIDRARKAGADDRAIHDTVLISAAFCMFNRYVDGLGSWTPDEQGIYEQIGSRLAVNGYVNPES